MKTTNARSFSAAVKEELIRMPAGRACCMLSEISALTQTVRGKDSSTASLTRSSSPYRVYMFPSIKNAPNKGNKKDFKKCY